MLDETIIAISTPAGYGGLGMVRLSGSRALGIAKKIFRPRRIKWQELEPRTLLLGEALNGTKKGIIDEALLAHDQVDDLGLNLG